VGHAIHAPELGHDDFAGVELRGRIAVLLPGAPESFDDNARAYYSATREKFTALAERGAVGAVIVSSPQFEARVPWARMQAAWDKPAMRLHDAEGIAVDGFPQLQGVAAVGVAAADRLLFAPGRAAAGAVGPVIGPSPQFEARVPWARMPAAWDKPAMRLHDAEGIAVDGFPQLQGVAAVGVAAADRLLFAPGRAAAEVFDRARAGT